MQKADYQLPHDFEMFTDDGNEQVYAAISLFLNHPEVIAAKAQLATPQERLDAFQDNSVLSSEGTTYDEYFGYRSHH